jgi:hypothetical protein
MPLKDPGRMVLPPVWVPRPRGAWKSPTAAPEPEEEPPGVRLGSWGLCVLGPWVVAANSVVVVLPKMRAPALRRIRMEPASTWGASPA